MHRALMRINIFLQHRLWEWSVYVTCIEGKRAAEGGEKKKLGGEIIIVRL